jgi:hypothetical protein
MSFSVLVETQDGQIAASLAGAPNVRVVQPTRSQAIAALRSEIQQRIEIGEHSDRPIDGRSGSAEGSRVDRRPGRCRRWVAA